MSTPDTDRPDHLYLLVRAYQDVFIVALATSDRGSREALAHVQGLLLEQIFLALREPLLALARGWTRSLLFREQVATNSYRHALESLAMSAFGDIAAALPACRIQPGRAIAPYLIQIARNNLYDQERAIYEGSEQRHVGQASQAASESAAMWPRSSEAPRGIWGAAGLDEPEDPAGLEDRLIARCDNQRLRQAAEAFWRAKLSQHDRRIVALRLSGEAPAPFETIAEQLGPGWTAAAVRQRYHRALVRTRTYLVDQGLVDGEV
jgi:hypothetical protein